MPAVLNSTTTTVKTDTAVYVSRSSGTLQCAFTVSYVLGIVGNLLALVFLSMKSTRPNNQKHRMMLKCLAANDLIAMLGMLLLMYGQMYLSEREHEEHMIKYLKPFCQIRVFWRVFGLGSGCVTVVMAAERYLAITKPFFYQKHVTAVLLRRCIFGLWIFTVILVCMPLCGFGLYFEEDTRTCTRFRSAHNFKDKTYAFLYFLLGLIFCICIVFCNIAVMRSLCFKGLTYNQNDYEPYLSGFRRIRERAVLMRRISRSVSRMSTTSTREEMAFGRLMILLCVIFLSCWMPQLLTIPMTIINSEKFKSNSLYKVADLMLLLHFLLDPCVYVIQRLPMIRRILCIMRPHHHHHHNITNGSIRIVSPDASSGYFSKV